MNTLTYIEARDKIWNAYFRDEILPLKSEFCFCGTLAGNSRDWNYSEPTEVLQKFGYSIREFKSMEYALLGMVRGREHYTMEKEYENDLFEGMLAALEVLKSIHRERGEVIPEDEPLLTKRAGNNY